MRMLMSISQHVSFIDLCYLGISIDSNKLLNLPTKKITKVTIYTNVFVGPPV